MCTVSFLPLSSGAADFLFTSNRDEAPGRQALPPAAHQLGEVTWHGPRDPQGGGTWFGTDGQSFALCLLNGAFVKHQHQPPYRQSRGLLIPHFLQSPDPLPFAEAYPFAGMEPFTLLVVDFGSGRRQLHELRWDETQLHLRTLDADQPQLWSSATLYTAEQAAVKMGWFRTWLEEQTAFSQEAIFHFHQTAGIGDPTLDVLMDRKHVKTTSITSYSHRQGVNTLRYLDTQTHEKSTYTSF